MKKNKENKKIIEHMQFDNYEYAKSVYEGCHGRLEKVKRGFIVSAVATFASILMFYFSTRSSEEASLTLVGVFGAIAIIGSIVSYIIGGGMKIVLKVAKKIAFWGWFILPFPYDIATGIMSPIVAIYAFFWLPVIFVYANYKQIKCDMEDAEEYMRFCKPVENVCAEECEI